MNHDGHQGHQEVAYQHPGERAEAVAAAVVEAAFRVHRALGPGLLESAYQQCLTHALQRADWRVECEVPLPIVFDGLRVDGGYRIDMVVEDLVLVENKAGERLLPIHEAQLLTYMRLSGKPLGFLLNWNVRLMKTGIHRFVLTLPCDTVADAATTRKP